MTPLAHAITREHLLAASKRNIRDQCGLLDRMDDIHCFEVSEIAGVAEDLHARLVDDIALGNDGLATIDEEPRFADMATATSFLPAPKTWIEWRHPGGFRRGFLLAEEGEWARLYQADGDKSGIASLAGTVRIGLGAGSGDPGALEVPNAMGREDVVDWSKKAIRLNVFLALINTPRIIGRRQHMPHRSLERALLAKHKAVGSFPLHAWTEIKLEVGRPPTIAGDESIEAHLTGQKALHFCRAHLRVRNGHVEIVRSHWRGNPALGTMQSRYSVTPAKAA